MGTRSAGSAGVAGKALGGVRELLDLMGVLEHVTNEGVGATVEAVLELTGYLAELESSRRDQAEAIPELGDELPRLDRLEPEEALLLRRGEEQEIVDEYALSMAAAGLDVLYVTSPPNILYLHSHDTGRYVQPYGHSIPTPNVQLLACPKRR